MNSHFSTGRGVALACAVTGATALLPGLTQAQFTAADYATNAAYADGWQTNDNGGFGFSAWGFNGTYNSAVQHALTSGSVSANPLGLAWTLYNPNGREIAPTNFAGGTGGTDISRAGRAFAPLQVGQTISTVFANPSQRFFYRGYTIRLVSGTENTTYGGTNAVSRLSVGTFQYFNAGQWSLGGATSLTTSLVDTDTTTGARLNVTMTGPGTNQYKLVMTPLANPSLAYTNIGKLADGGPVNWVQFELYNTDSDWYPSPVAGAQRTDFYVSSLTITTIQPVPPEIIQQPRSVLIFPGRTAHFSVEPIGSPLAYQWRRNGTNLVNGGNISGAQSDNLVIAGVSGADVATYTVVITNTVGAVTSSPPASLSLVAPSGTPYETAVAGANPVGYWRFNETNNPAPGTALAQDYVGSNVGVYGGATSNKFNGVLGPQPDDGFSVFEAGNGACYTVGYTPQSWVTLPALDLNTNTVTLTGWIYPDGPQADNAGLIFSRGSGSGTGLSYGAPSLGSGNQLAYAWNTNDPGTWQFISSLGIPSGQWSFIALVVQPTQAILHLHNANGAASATNAIPHLVEPWAGEVLVGSDPFSVNRTFNGRIDEFAIWNRALTEGELLDLYNAVLPPPNVILTIEPAGSNVQLTWPQGLLLEAPNVTGPWTTNNAASPYTFAPSGDRKFYRVLVP
jgi:hypothetical protein